MVLAEFLKESIFQASEALHMVSFEIFVKSMMPSLLELKVTPMYFLLHFQNPWQRDCN
jgi:hypothetical protein